MQYKVPQNVDIEDKVVAGLTLRQFMFLMVSAGMILMLNFVFIDSIRLLFFPVAILVASLGLALAFLKVNDRPFEIFLMAATKTFITPSRRVWRKEVEVHETITKVEHRPVYHPPRKGSLEDVRSNLEKLATIVDSGSLNGVSVNDEYLTNIEADSSKEPVKVYDVLTQAEEKSPQLDDYLETSRKQVASQKEMMPISELTEEQPTTTTYKYEKIELKDEDELENILEKANNNKEMYEAKLDSAEIRKH
jgi:hypothetical protein